ncbi:MAG: T9SS type A sorting domain-containing protein [Flavobacteriales bacterium]
MKKNFRCPATVSTSGGFRANESICGAINYTVELIEINQCGGKDTLSKAVQFETPSTEPKRKFCYEENERRWHRWYRVRWRPNFFYGPGIFGPSHDCFIAASEGDYVTCLTDVTLETESVREDLHFQISESMPGGVRCWGIQNGREEVKIRIYDAVGRKITEEITYFENGEDVFVKSINGLKPGLYIIVFSSGNAGFPLRYVQE